MGSLDGSARHAADGSLDSSARSAVKERSAEYSGAEASLSRSHLRGEAHVAGNAVHAASSGTAVSLNVREYTSRHSVAELVHVANSSVGAVSEGRYVEMSISAIGTDVIYTYEPTLVDVESSRTVVYASVEEVSAEAAAIGRHGSAHGAEIRSVNESYSSAEVEISSHTAG